MKLFGIFKKKQPQPAVRSRVPMPEPVAEEKPANPQLDAILACIKEQTAQQAYRIAADTEAATNIFSSKLGGAPYWDKAQPYPTDQNGNPLYLLLQLNFDRLAVADERLPQGGMLQFYISELEECIGKVVYHPVIDSAAVPDDSLPAMPCDELLPVLRETAVRLEAFEDVISTSCYDFDAVMKAAIAAVTGTELGDTDWTDYLSDTDCDTVYRQFGGEGSKLFGYPVFTQWDPREEGTNYPQLLLQVDSDLKERTVMWGDCGEGNFFIGTDDLAAHSYQDVLYYWDCC